MGDTSLIDAVKVLEERLETQRQLIRSSELSYLQSTDYERRQNYTRLYSAVKSGREEAIKLLLSKDTHAKRKDDSTFLHMAVEYGDPEMIEALLKFGAVVDSKDKHGRTALHIAVQRRFRSSLKMIEILLKFGADIDSKDKYGLTPLAIACDVNKCEHYYYYDGSLTIVELFLKFDASINSKDVKGRTELHYACQRGNALAVEILLEHGCDINITCKYNHTPLDHAMMNYPRSKVIKILKRHIIKMKTANLTVHENNLLSISSDDETNNEDLRYKCEKELVSMKSEKFNNADVSFYDILTKSVNQLAVYAKNENIAQVLKSEDYKIKFPIYASMINSNFRKGEKRKEFLEESNKVFNHFHYNFGLPPECTEKIYSYLSNKDLKVLLSAYKCQQS